MANKTKRKQAWEKTNFLVYAILVAGGNQLFSFVSSNFLQQTKLASIFSYQIYLKLTINDIVFYFIVLVLFIKFLYRLALPHAKKSISAVTETIVSLQTKLSNFVVQSEYFDSAQLYHCNISVTNQHIIKVMFICGYAAEASNLNSIVQGYYYFDHDIYKKICSFVKCYEDYQLSEKRKDTDISGRFNKAYAVGLDLIHAILTQLNKVETPSEVQQNQCELYRIYIYVLSIIAKLRGVLVSNGSHEENEFIVVNTGLANKEVETALQETKKTGLVGVLFLKNVIYEETNSKFEPNRTYYAKLFTIKKVKYICLVSINSESILDPDTIEGKCDEQLEQFVETLTEEISSVNL